MAQNTTHPEPEPGFGVQDDPIVTLAGELALLVAEESKPEICACGASWSPDRAGAVVARLGIRPATHLSKD